MGPEIVVPLAGMATAIILAIGVPVARAWTRKLDAESKNPRVPLEIGNRLERMEQAIDAVAVEIERISEGQRFTTRLLAEGKNAAAESSPSTSAGRAQDRS